jgi:protoporphyrinogen oxidase
LAAGYELAKHGVQPLLFEADRHVGGISKTVQHNGNYFDLGGHRFFTKLDPVNELWQEVLGDKFMRRPRQSRIYYRNKFFNYPLTPMNALLGVGLIDTARILCSFGVAQLFPNKTENTFEEWVSNRFGKRLFSIFFKTYTEKVWGIPCSEIQAEWAAQRIKGLSLYSAVMNALFKPKGNKIKTLIDEFDYPEFGPGMMYDAMQAGIQRMGGTVQMQQRIVGVRHEGGKVLAVEYETETGERVIRPGTDFLSSIPLTELVQIMSPSAPETVLHAARSLKYRSLVTVDITVDQKELFTDNWIYVHSPEVKLGRIQNFKNWSPSMVADPSKTTLGLEYFCNEGDDFWNMDDQAMFELAADEVAKIKICERNRIEDFVIVRVPKAYPVYDMEYPQHLAIIRSWLDGFSNLQPIGRYGMFKYNNMDHSILTGLYAAQNILAEQTIHDIWDINTDEEYHEEKRDDIKLPETAEPSKRRAA